MATTDGVPDALIIRILEWGMKQTNFKFAKEDQSGPEDGVRVTGLTLQQDLRRPFEQLVRHHMGDVWYEVEQDAGAWLYDGGTGVEIYIEGWDKRRGQAQDYRQNELFFLAQVSFCVFVKHATFPQDRIEVGYQRVFMAKASEGKWIEEDVNLYCNMWYDVGHQWERVGHEHPLAMQWAKTAVEEFEPFKAFASVLRASEGPQGDNWRDWLQMAVGRVHAIANEKQPGRGGRQPVYHQAPLCPRCGGTTIPPQ